MDQVNVQRVLGARSVDQGQKGAIFAGFLKLLIPFILVLPGVIAHALYRNLPKADMAYPRLVTDLLPVGLRGLVRPRRTRQQLFTMTLSLNPMDRFNQTTIQRVHFQL